ncbi:MAG: hypothetical protein EBT39_03160 [Sphingobacteriia bacterium]|nr:hypothetical protein [Candidatus Fonsibacter lacus]
MGDDYLEVQGKVPGEIQGGVRQQKSPAKIITSMDHRIAMSFLVMGLMLAHQTITIWLFLIQALWFR